MIAWFDNFWDSLPELFKDVFYWIINTLIEISATIFQWVLALLPTYIPPKPQLVDNGWPIIKTLCWLIPVGYIAQLLAAVTVAYTVMWTLGGILRRLHIIK